jgi:hypothetical protein
MAVLRLSRWGWGETGLSPMIASRFFPNRRHVLSRMSVRDLFIFPPY